MSETIASKSLRDDLITFITLYVLLTAVGNLGMQLWMWEPARPACLALFAALVALYAFGTGPGSRTDWRIYFLCGVLLWGALWAVAIIGYALPLSYEAYTLYEVLIAGFVVKIEATGGHGPMWLDEILRALGIVLAVVAAPALRAVGRKLAAS